MSITVLFIISTLQVNCLLAGFIKPKKDLIKIYQKPNKKSLVIGYFCKKDFNKKEKNCLNKNEILKKAVKREGLYWRVFTGNSKEGYVSILKVKKAKSKDKSSFSNILRDAVQKKMSDTVTNSRQRSTVMGVRGLDENDRISSAGHVNPNLRLVNNMEKISILENDLEDLEEQIHAELEKKNK